MDTSKILTVQAVLCHAVPCCAVPWCAAPCRAMPWSVCRAVLCRGHCAVPCGDRDDHRAFQFLAREDWFKECHHSRPLILSIISPLSMFDYILVILQSSV